MTWGWLVNMATCDTVLRPAARYAFDKVDTDKSGEISVKELKSALEYLSSYVSTNMCPSEENLTWAISYCDKDKSGTISFEEFMEFLRKISELTSSYV